MTVDPKPSAREPLDIGIEVTSGTTPTGTVTVTDGGRVLGTAELADGSATVVVGAYQLSPGRHRLRITYEGDAGHVGSSKTVDIIVRNKA